MKNKYKMLGLLSKAIHFVASTNLSFRLKLSCCVQYFYDAAVEKWHFILFMSVDA